MAITQPSNVTFRSANVTTKLTWNPSFGSDKTKGFTEAQKFVDSEVLRYMDPLSPWRTGMMVKSATIGTVIGSGHIIYNSVYARRQYYEHKTRGRWFEKVKASKGEALRKGAAAYVAGNY